MDKLVTGPFGSNACYENTFEQDGQTITTWMCMGSGFTTSTLMDKDSEATRNTLETSPELYKDLMHIDENIRRAKNIEPNFCWECYSCVKACPNHAIDVRGYADFAPMGHSVRVRREEEKGTISWKIKFRNGTTKDFVSPITTKPWGKFIPKLAEGEKIKQGELNSQRLYTEPEGLNIDGELPVVPKESFKKGVYY